MPAFRLRLSDKYKAARLLAVGSDKEEISAPMPSVTSEMSDDDNEDVELPAMKRKKVA